jgi:hypothetical protein
MMTLDDRTIEAMTVEEFELLLPAFTKETRVDLLTRRIGVNKLRPIIDSGVSLNTTNQFGKHFLTYWFNEIDNLSPDQEKLLLELDGYRKLWQHANPIVQLIEAGIALGADPFLPDPRSGKSAVELAVSQDGGFKEPLRALGLWNSMQPIDHAIFEMVNGYTEYLCKKSNQSLQILDDMFANDLNPNEIGTLRGSFVHFATAGYLTKYTYEHPQLYRIKPYYEQFSRLAARYGGDFDVPCPENGFSGLDMPRNNRSTSHYPKTVRRKRLSPNEFVAKLMPGTPFPLT